MADKAARAGFSNRELDFLFRKQLTDDFLHCGVAFAVNMIGDSAVDPLAQFFQPGLGLAGYVFDRNPQRDLREACAESDASLFGLDKPRDRLVERRFADAEGLERACRENRLHSAVLLDPWDDAVFHHRLHLTRLIALKIRFIWSTVASSRQSFLPVSRATVSVVRSSAVGPIPPVEITMSAICIAVRHAHSRRSGTSPTVSTATRSTPVSDSLSAR